MRTWVALASLVLAVASAARARAAEPQTAPAAPSPRRQLPDYRGRPADPDPGGTPILWVLRIVLAPFYLVSQYVIRWPLSVAVPAAERAEVPRKAYDFFAFGPEHRAGIVPVGFVAFDFNPSVGVYAFWYDAFARGNDWTLHAEAWPEDWYATSFRERARIGEDTAVAFHFTGVHRPDRVFYGLGPRSLQADQSRFTEAKTEEGVTLELDAAGRRRFEIGMGLRSESIGPGSYGSDPSVEAQAATGAFALPPGYGARTTAAYTNVLTALDTRRPAPAPGSGARVQAEGELGAVPQGPSPGWVRYGAYASLFLDLSGHQHVVTLSAAARFADPLGEGAIPFTEQVSLGGDGPMRGYFPRRMIDRSAAVASVHYAWPIAPWVGGNLEAAVGNVFGEHLQGFQPDLLRLSADAGLTTVGLTEYPLELIVGVGSETFAQGGRLDSLRVALSVNHGF